jgi:hypothetical protein
VLNHLSLHGYTYVYVLVFVNSSIRYPYFLLHQSRCQRSVTFRCIGLSLLDVQWWLRLAVGRYALWWLVALRSVMM